jgi:hypothetical protein
MRHSRVLARLFKPADLFSHDSFERSHESMYRCHSCRPEATIGPLEQTRALGTSLSIFMKQSHHKRHSACGKPPGVTLYHNGNFTRTLFVFPGTQDKSMLGDYAREMSTSDRLLMLRKSDQKAARAAKMSLGVAPHVQKSAFEYLQHLCPRD